MRHQNIRARLGHCLRLLRIEYVGAGQHVQLMGFAHHLDLQAVAHAGLLQILPEDAVDQADRREVLHSVEALRFELLEVDVHYTERIRSAYARQHRSMLDDRENLGAHLHHDLVGVAIGQKPGQRAAPRHAVTTGVVDDEHVRAAGFAALCRDAGSGAHTYQNLPVGDFLLEFRDDFCTCSSFFLLVFLICFLPVERACALPTGRLTPYSDGCFSLRAASSSMPRIRVYSLIGIILST